MHFTFCVFPLGIAMGLRVGSLPEQLPANVKSLVPAAVGQQPVVTNAHESFWQAMQQEPPNKLDCRQTHHALSLPATVVFISKDNLPAGQANQPPV